MVTLYFRFGRSEAATSLSTVWVMSAFEPCVLVGAAVGRQNAVVLARVGVASACFGGVSGRLTGVVAMRSKVVQPRKQQRKRRRRQSARRGSPSGSPRDSHQLPPTSC